MGVTGLWKLLYDVSPSSLFNKTNLDNYNGKVIAIDGNHFLYKSLEPSQKDSRDRRNVQPYRTHSEPPKDDEPTSLLLRTFNNCVNLLNNGIKPVYVFDGGRSKLKDPVVQIRKEKREKARRELKEAQEKGDRILMKKLQPKTVQIGSKQIKNCRGLLKLMGIPYVNAPGEAEAQCAQLVDSGSVYATATEDSDAFAFGTKVVLRKFNPDSQRGNRLIEEIHLEKFLQLLNLSWPQLVDLSIMVGCDYCKGIAGMGVHRALELLHQYETIENILDKLDRNQFLIPDKWYFEQVRELYLKPKVSASKHKSLKWYKPNEDGIMEYLHGQNNFDEMNARSALENLPIFEESSTSA